MQPLLPPGRTLGIVGAGVMGTTILRGLLDAGLIDREQAWATAKTPVTAERVAAEFGVGTEARLDDAAVVVLCVKPKGVATAVESLKGLPEDAVVVTILAGVTTARLEGLLGTANPVVRAMTNTPCVVGQGMTAVCGGKHATPAHVEGARRMFAAVGRCVATDEAYFDAITAMGGSGPAYVYLILEAFADAGVNVGMPRALALEVAAQTMLGAATMVQKTGRHPAALRDDVTTPAGCTIGGLMVMEDGKIRSVLNRAIEESTRIVGALGRS